MNYHRYGYIVRPIYDVDGTNVQNVVTSNLAVPSRRNIWVKVAYITNTAKM